MSRGITNALLGFSLLAGFLLQGCAKSAEQPQETAPQAAAQPTGPTEALPSPSPQVSPVLQIAIAATPSPATPPTPPSTTEVNEAVTRVFAKVASPGTQNPSFVTGDFNGDGAEDLAVVVRPNDQQLTAMNDEMANWILEDPRKVFLPQPILSLAPPKQPALVHAEKGETLLAIIHGVGPTGWRNAEAKQTFLLKNTGTNLTTESRKSLRESKDKQELPPIRGDAIREAIRGKSGLILWNGAKYGWYSTEL